jgi:outer membrane protein assembly factor BamB/tetratricopeptide (TPR) repeat protein
MTLKGNLEVLNLSDIFQSLSLNQHTGTLRVTDGKREKLVHFAQGEITLLASEKKVKIGEMLVGSGKISQEDLDYALTQQKKSKKKLGEILIEEGFVSEDDIADIVKQQIEAEIYDLFLWKKADFEFLIDYIPEKLKNPTHGITKLQFNTSSLIMEALRRLDEWGIISKEISTLKEVYKVVKPNAPLDEIDLPERVKAEMKLIDGERTVEAIAEETSLSEFELCKLIYELKTRGIVAPLTPQELSDKADDAFQRGKYKQASLLYERLIEVLPKNMSIRWHLADSLKAYGDEQRALEQYLFIAGALEATRDRLELAKAYRAILDLAPDRKDILERLRTLDRAKLQSRAMKSFVLVGLLAAAVGGAIYTYGPEKVFGPIRAKIQEWTKGSGGTGVDVAAEERAANELLKKSEDAFRSHDYEGSFRHGLEVMEKYPRSAARTKLLMPLYVRSDPPGRDVYIEGVQKGRTDAVIQVAAKPDPKTKIKVEIRDGDRVIQAREIDFTRWQPVEFDLFKHPVFEAPTKGAVRCAPVFRNNVAYFASLDGYLHGRPLDGGPATLWHPLTLESAGDPFAFAVSNLALVDDAIIYATLEGDVRAFSLAFRQKAFTLRPFEGGGMPILSGPVATQGGQTLVVAGSGGEIGFIDLRRQAMVGRPILTSNRVTADLAEAGNVVFVGGRDNWLYAINAADRRVLWARPSRGDFLASPKPVGDRLLVAGDASGELVCLDRETGARVWSVDLGAPIVGVDASPEAAVATTSVRQGASWQSECRAVGISSGRLLWKAATPHHPGRPLIARDVVFVGGDGACIGIDLKTGGERWSAKPSRPTPKAVNYRGKPALHGGRIYVGAEDGVLYGFDPN